MLLHLPYDALDDLARVLEGGEDLLRVAEPVGVDLEHRVKVVNVRQVFLELRLKVTRGHTGVTVRTRYMATQDFHRIFTGFNRI